MHVRRMLVFEGKFEREETDHGGRRERSVWDGDERDATCQRSAADVATVAGFVSISTACFPTIYTAFPGPKALGRWPLYPSEVAEGKHGKEAESQGGALVSTESAQAERESKGVCAESTEAGTSFDEEQQNYCK